MKSAKVLGNLFVGIFLLLWGLLTLLSIDIPGEQFVLGGLAIIGGLLMLLGM